MENHADRKEIQSARQTGDGESSRYSATLLEETLYHARLLSDGTVLRISTNRLTIPALLMEVTLQITDLSYCPLVLLSAGQTDGGADRRSFK